MSHFIKPNVTQPLFRFFAKPKKKAPFFGLQFLFLFLMFLGVGSLTQAAYNPNDLPSEPQTGGEWIYWRAISNCSQLQNINQNLYANYYLTQDIECAETSSWNNYAGFQPIKDFRGSLNGNDKRIYNLYINRPSLAYVGLFGNLKSGSISNIGLVDINIRGQNLVGGLAGANDGSSIFNSYSTGSVFGNGSEIGGLVGFNGSSISKSYSTGAVHGTNNYVGGLVGHNHSGNQYNASISNSYATGEVSGAGIGVGGLVGQNEASPISNSYSTGAVHGTNNYVGGLVGWNIFAGSLISNSYSTGNVSGSGDDVGGLVGANMSSGSISKSYSTGGVSGSSNVGGLIGDNSYSDIYNSSSTGNVSGSGNNIGGLVGKTTKSIISNSYATGEVNGAGDVGGMVGNNNGSISDSSSTGNVSGSGDDVGGLVGMSGYYAGPISNSYSTGNVNGRYWVGGLVGFNGISAIHRSYATGNVSGNGAIGGLMGHNSGSISSSYSTGNVSGNDEIGGLVGNNSGSISNSYSIGKVSGNDGVGGLVGINWASILNSYSIGEVNGKGVVGGLVGYNGGSISNSLFNYQTSGQNDNDGRGIPKTTAEMRNIMTFFSSTWDISYTLSFVDTIWKIDSDKKLQGGYPYLFWQIPLVIEVDEPEDIEIDLILSQTSNPLPPLNVSNYAQVKHGSLTITDAGQFALQIGGFSSFSTLIVPNALRVNTGTVFNFSNDPTPPTPITGRLNIGGALGAEYYCDDTGSNCVKADKLAKYVSGRCSCK